MKNSHRCTGIQAGARGRGSESCVHVWEYLYIYLLMLFIKIVFLKISYVHLKYSINRELKEISKKSGDRPLRRNFTILLEEHHCSNLFFKFFMEV